MNSVRPLLVAASLWPVFGSAQPTPAPRPNIVFVLADDLGYGELGSYGQTVIQTPHLDRLAQEGLRFTRFYAGSTVCAPSRSVLLTGQHTGHTTVRGNSAANNYAGQTLKAEDVTFAETLQRRNYATGLIGKWGLGEADTPGAPWRQGFDSFFGFLNQTHAHNHFPDHLWRNDERVPLRNDLTPVGAVPGAGYASQTVEYANDLFFTEAHAFLERHRTEPFLLFLSLTVPHANNERARALGDGQEVPDYGPYAKQPWPDSLKGQAAMITRMDAGVGALLDQLTSLGLAENTIVFFTSDNGPHNEGGPHYDPAFFNSGGGLRGLKRDLTEGGIRVPLIVRWPGVIAGGRTTDEVTYFGDLLPTFAALAGATQTGEHDGLSLVPLLRDEATPTTAREFLYWEFYEGGFQQAVLLDGRWKGIRDAADDQVVLYDLQSDPGETRDVAPHHPTLAKRIAQIMEAEHTPNEYWHRPAAPKTTPAASAPTAAAP